MEDVVGVSGDLSGELLQRKIQGGRKVPVNGAYIDFTVVRFGK